MTDPTPDTRVKHCPKCSTTKPVSSFHNNRSRYDGLGGHCKDCHNSLIASRMTNSEIRAQKQATDRALQRRLRREDPEWLERRRKADRQAQRPRRKPDPVKDRARSTLRRAVRSGKVQRPDTCSDCGTSEHRIEAHHHDYTKPLDVEWLCSLCHGQRHWKEPIIALCDGSVDP